MVSKNDIVIVSWMFGCAVFGMGSIMFLVREDYFLSFFLIMLLFISLAGLFGVE
jgi:hypothetical protein